ncbi:GtrA family protein [Agarilytica rhodophyticola]|uniref:GtrA family protein n=1 Tax=Agarilytica rhodophyticola TaxID=1737490 RepID=UPI000B3463BB|nr:GtrA family protein [Agarilytica rhodophyticola]
MMNRNTLKQVFAFGCVGVLATAVHYCVALFLSEAQLTSVYLANICGYLTAVLVSLYGHSIFTYKKKVNIVVAQRFAIVSVSTLLCSEILLFVLQSTLQINHRISLAIIVASVPVVSFFLNKFWVYAHSES